MQEVVVSVGLTVGANLLVGRFIFLTLPSMVIPFSGIVVGMLRAVVWRLLFSPGKLDVTGPGLLAQLLTLGVLLLEGQGYVLAMFAAYDQGRAWLWPRRVGATNRIQGYWMGLKRSAGVYLLVAGILIVAALYEVLITVLVLPLLV